MMCLDPERMRNSRIAANVFPKARIVYKVTDAEGIQGDAQPVLRRATAAPTSATSSDLLAGMGDEADRGARGRGRGRGLRRGRQRAGQAREQDHRRRLQPGRLGHPHRALSGQGEDRDPLPQGRLRSRPTSRCRRATARRSWRASRSCATSTSRRRGSPRTARSSSRSSARSTSSCAWRPSRPRAASRTW